MMLLLHDYSKKGNNNNNSIFFFFQIYLISLNLIFILASFTRHSKTVYSIKMKKIRATFLADIKMESRCNHIAINSIFRLSPNTNPHFILSSAQMSTVSTSKREKNKKTGKDQNPCPKIWNRQLLVLVLQRVLFVHGKMHPLPLRYRYARGTMKNHQQHRNKLPGNYSLTP